MGEKQNQPFQLSFHASRDGVTLLILGAIVAAASMLGERAAAQPKSGQDASAAHLASITIDYPLDGSIFPPEITPPTFIWRDAAENATRWRIDIAFADGSAEMHFQSAGERLAIGEIDQRCVSPTNELPKLTPEQAEAHTWIPEAGAWEAIKKHSVAGRAIVTIRGFSQQDAQHAVSSGRVTIFTSRDPVGAPIFYRDVPLMPSETEKGIIKPLAPDALHLVQWRLRDIGKPESRVVLREMPTCANCHSFSLDGKTMGMDLDGPANNKGLYAIVPVKPEMSIRNQDVISWSSLRDERASTSRIGFMSQVSPDGRYVLTNYRGQTKELSNGYFTVNFKDYRFLQVFYPTRSIVAWYNRATGRKQPLPGADDPRYVQTNAVWSPDGKYVVFVRAEAKDPYPPGNKMPEHANDPEEPQIQYDLYRIPFNDGKGGPPAPIAGASHNGMSNSFPKVSPDGRWIVFVKCRNAQLMRPDSQLYIVPAAGGVARRMRCNTSLMNSWHSFSPNGRWLVFSSKSRSPYTQMFLTHLDEEGNDSPPILIENATAANRAVNIPEFVNVQPEAFLKLDAPVTKFYDVFDRAMALEKKGQHSAAVAEWRKALELDPEDAKANNNLGLGLTRDGRLDEAIPHFEKAVEGDPRFAEAYNNLGIARAQKGQVEEAIRHFQKAVELEPDYGSAHNNLGAALLQSGRIDEAIPHFQKAVEVIPDFADAHNNLGMALLQKGNVDEATPHFQKAVEVNPNFADAHNNLGITLLQNGKVDEAIPRFQKAVEISPDFADAHDNLGMALLEKGKGDEAIPHFQKALELDPRRAQTYYNLGGALYMQGKVREALARWREGLRADPNSLPLLNQTAWVLATCPDASVRNGPEAVELAERAVKVSPGPDPGLLDVLAAAYAEVGRFLEAVQIAHRALDLATQQNAQTLIEGLKARIAHYESKSPFRDRQ